MKLQMDARWNLPSNDYGLAEPIQNHFHKRIDYNEMVPSRRIQYVSNIKKCCTFMYRSSCIVHYATMLTIYSSDVTWSVWVTSFSFSLGKVSQRAHLFPSTHLPQQRKTTLYRSYCTVLIDRVLFPVGFALTWY